MIQLPLVEYWLPFLLYAEIHYSFKGIYSRLKKREPEILADVPFRIEPNHAIPVLIFIKDAQHYPILLKRVTLQLIQEQQCLRSQEFHFGCPVQEKFWHQILEFEPEPDISGPVKVNVIIEIEINGQTKRYFNDNYRLSSHLPFDVYLAREPLPTLGGVVWGDLHYHSNYTEDQVEFGAPLPATAHLAEALGLKFFAATDHSYDLDDYQSNVLKNDPDLKKWRQFRQEVQDWNRRNPSVVILPGEEVSCANHRNQNVHFLILNQSDFIPGKGDGAERWFQTQPDLSISSILKNLGPDALAFASHPEVVPPLLQKILIRRGKWELPDYQHPRLNGLQIWNGKDDRFFERSLQRWQELLLAGHRLLIVAGNDAHGNFNRFRQIGFPFWTFREQHFEIFGYARTGVIITTSFSPSAILQNLRKGAVVISNGPLVMLNARDALGSTWLGPGAEVHHAPLSLRVTAASTAEFGDLQAVKIIAGDLLTKKESVLHSCHEFTTTQKCDFTAEFSALPEQGYLRSEVTTRKDHRIYRAYTNPIWIRSLR
jgi:hypothetical protein